MSKLCLTLSLLGLLTLLSLATSCSNQNKQDSNSDTTAIVAAVEENSEATTNDNDSVTNSVSVIEPSETIGNWDLYYQHIDNQYLHWMVSQVITADYKLTFNADPCPTFGESFEITPLKPNGNNYVPPYVNGQMLNVKLGSLPSFKEEFQGHIRIPTECIEQAIEILEKGNCSLTINQDTYMIKDELKGISKAWKIMKEKTK